MKVDPNSHNDLPSHPQKTKASPGLKRQSQEVAGLAKTFIPLAQQATANTKHASRAKFEHQAKPVSKKGVIKPAKKAIQQAGAVSPHSRPLQ